MAMAFLLTACMNINIGGSASALKENSEMTVTGEDPETDAGEEGSAYLTDSVLSTDLIEVTVPDELAGTTYAQVYGDSIDIYDKALVDAGYPGLVFTIGTSEDCSVYAGGMFTKEGEVFTADGTIYNVGKGTASEIQWDYNEPDMPESYRKLYDAADSIIEGISGVGENRFVYRSGTRGEELYPEVLNECMADEEIPADTGYAYADVNGDGIDELIIGGTGSKQSSILRLYTMVDREPAYAAGGSEGNEYYALAWNDILNEYTGEAGETCYVIYSLEPNSTELFWQVGYKYDTAEDKDNPWFTAYNDREWEPITEEEFNSAITRINSDRLSLKFTPFK